VRFFNEPIAVGPLFSHSHVRLRKLEQEHKNTVMMEHFYPDQFSIECAISAAQAAGNDSTVELREGDFYLMRSVTENKFYGTLRAEGDDEFGGNAHLHALPGFSTGAFDWFDGELGGPSAILQFFVGGVEGASIAVAGLTMSVGGLTHLWYDHGSYQSVALSHGIHLLSSGDHEVDVTIRRGVMSGHSRWGAGGVNDYIYGYPWGTDFQDGFNLHEFYGGDIEITEVSTESLGRALMVSNMFSGNLTVDGLHDRNSNWGVSFP
jgi:hypothetical protein